MKSYKLLMPLLLSICTCLSVSTCLALPTLHEKTDAGPPSHRPIDVLIPFSVMDTSRFGSPLDSSLTPLFIDKSGEVAFAIGPNVNVGRAFSDGLLVVNSTEAGMTTRASWFAQYWLPNGELAVDNSFEDAKSSSEGLCAIKSQYKWGFCNHSGEVVIPCTFLDVKPFRSGRAAVRTSTGWGFINRQGMFVAQPVYQECLSFSESMAAVQLNDKIGFIDLNGSLVVQPQFKRVRSFNDGLARVITDATGTLPAGGFIDQKGAVAIDFRNLNGKSYSINDATTHSGFWSGYALAVDQRFLWNFQLPDYSEKDFHGGLLCTSVDGKAGFIDRTGKVVIKPEFENAGPFSEGLAAVRVNSLFGFINPLGELVIPARYVSVDRFSDGMAAVSPEKGRWGYINKFGKLVVAAQYEQAGFFHDGIARVGVKPGSHHLQCPAVAADEVLPVITKSEVEQRIADRIKARWRRTGTNKLVSEEFAFKVNVAGAVYELSLEKGFKDAESIEAALRAILEAMPFTSPSVTGRCTRVRCVFSGSTSDPVIKVSTVNEVNNSDSSLEEKLGQAPFADKVYENDSVIRPWLLARLVYFTELLSSFPDNKQLLSCLTTCMSNLGLDSSDWRAWSTFAFYVKPTIRIARNPDKKVADASAADVAANFQAWTLHPDAVTLANLELAYRRKFAYQCLKASAADPLILATAAVLSQQYTTACKLATEAKALKQAGASELLASLAPTGGLTFLPAWNIQKSMKLSGSDTDCKNALRWLPPSTETVIAANGSFYDMVNEPSSVSESAGKMAEKLRSSLRSFAIGIGASGSKASKDVFRESGVAYALKGARTFKLPSGLGVANVPDANIIVFKPAECLQADRLMKVLALDGCSQRLICNTKVLVSESSTGEHWQSYTDYICEPAPGVILHSLDESYLTEILLRLQSSAVEGTLATSSAEWQFSTPKPDVWAVRQYSKYSAPFDRTAQTNADGHFNAPSTDRPGMKVVRRIGLNITPSGDDISLKVYSDSRDELAQCTEMWKSYLSHNGKRNVAATLHSDHAEIRFGKGEHDDGSVFLMVLALLGYSIYL